MDVLAHLIYEYQKKLRSLALHTFSTTMMEQVERKLTNQHIDYYIQYVTAEKANVFFGETDCVNIIRKIGQKPLNKYTAEEDFILGIMLGYDRVLQCQRYLKRSEKQKQYHQPNNLQLQILSA